MQYDLHSRYGRSKVRLGLPFPPAKLGSSSCISWSASATVLWVEMNTQSERGTPCPNCACADGAGDAPERQEEEDTCR